MNANVVLGIMAAMMVGMIVMTIGMISVLRQFNEVVRVLEENDKETPMKPIGLEDEYNVTYVIKFTHMCSHCNDNFLSISDKYCKECGQKIDWSDEE